MKPSSGKERSTDDESDSTSESTGACQSIRVCLPTGVCFLDEDKERSSARASAKARPSKKPRKREHSHSSSRSHRRSEEETKKAKTTGPRVAGQPRQSVSPRAVSAIVALKTQNGEPWIQLAFRDGTYQYITLRWMSSWDLCDYFPEASALKVIIDWWYYGKHNFSARTLDELVHPRAMEDANKLVAAKKKKSSG